MSVTHIQGVIDYFREDKWFMGLRLGVIVYQGVFYAFNVSFTRIEAGVAMSH